jgi:hypothetical protein
MSDLDHFPQRYGVDSDALDWWVDAHRRDITGSEDTRPARLDLAHRLLATQTRERLAGMLTVAIHRQANGGQPLPLSDGRRYLTAYRSARERAQNHLAALIEADAERDALRAELRARDEAVR